MGEKRFLRKPAVLRSFSAFREFELPRDLSGGNPTIKELIDYDQSCATTLQPALTLSAPDAGIASSPGDFRALR